MNHKFKVEKLENLKREVQDFHPVLHELFKRMKSFNRVEYRQGNREFGADFVLESFDDFGDLKYTGVVVKVGTITQDISEINRQIDECFTMPRPFDGGSKNIRITSVVVVSNSNITNNAQELIHKKYEGKPIKFLDKDSLIKLIDENYSSYWEDSRIFLNGFLAKQSEKANKICIGNILDFNSSENYVEIKIRKKEIKGKVNKISSFREASSLAKAIKVSNPILLEGVMGMGKSVMIAKHLLKVVEDFKKGDEELIPLLIEFANFKDDIVNGIKEEILTSIESLKDEISDYKFIVYMDGFDEVNLPLDERKDFIRQLYALMQEFSSFVFVVTTRTIEDYDFELFLSDFFDLYQLLPLQHNQVMSIVNSLYKSDQKTDNQIAESNLFKMLPKTPITAILLGQILKSDAKEIPSTLTELYSKFMEVVLSRWDSNNLKSLTEYEVLTNICGKFACFILDNSLPMIAIDQLNQMIREYLDERNLQIDIDHISSKIIKNNEIFVVNSEKNTIRFRHKSFCEYFYAHNIYKNEKALINEEIYNPYWHNSYFFYFGLVKDSSKLLQSLNEIKFTNYGLKILQVIINSELLLAAYLTPYKDIERQVNSSLQTAAEAVLELINDIDHINHLQNMQMTKFDMVMLMVVIISQSYNYEFYEKALKDAAEDILKIKSDLKEPEWLKLFFIGATLAENKDFTYINQILRLYNNKTLKISDENLQILFQIIATNKISNSEEVKKFLKTYRRNFKKGSKGAKLIQSLVKEK